MVTLSTLIVLGVCGKGCHRGILNPVEPNMRNLSAIFCPSQSHGLYRLLSTREPDDSSRTFVATPTRECDGLAPPLPSTYVCVYPPQTDQFVSRGIVWKGRWFDDCNEGFRLRTICNIIRAWRKASQKTTAPVWIFDVGANIGTFTLPLLAAGVNVASFEADPSNLALLRSSIAAQRRLGATGSQDSADGPTSAVSVIQSAYPRSGLLGASIVVAGALSETAGQQLCMGAEQKTNFGSVRVQPAGPNGNEGCTAHLVHTTTLDAAAETIKAFDSPEAFPALEHLRAPLHIAAIKMDVQVSPLAHRAAPTAAHSIGMCQPPLTRDVSACPHLLAQPHAECTPPRMLTTPPARATRRTC